MAGDAPGSAHENQAPAGGPAATARLALYRRYRPATFAEVKGQEHVTQPLVQALRNGRVNHAYLFSGPRGCGKTSSARILARSLNCVQGPTPQPCGVCESCVALAPSGPGSIDVIEIDAASHGGVDDARDLRERAFYAPVSGRFKVYIIDEAHMVTREGFNALLKLVEEPPSHLKFVFATTEPEKVIATIRSRTHHYPFRLVPPAVLRELLEEILAAEQVTYQPSVVPLVVRAGAGSVRDSLSVLDQLLAGAGEEGLTYERTVALLGYSDDALLDDMVDAFATGDGAAAFGTVDRVVSGGHDPRRFAADLLDRLRDLIILAAVPGAGATGLLDAPADRLERMTGQAGRFGQAELARAAAIFSDGLIQMRGTASPRLLLELMCAQVLLPGAGTDEKALLSRLDRLERRLDSGAVGTAPGPARTAPAEPSTSRPAAHPPGEVAGQDERPGGDRPGGQRPRADRPAAGDMPDAAPSRPATAELPGHGQADDRAPAAGRATGEPSAGRPAGPAATGAARTPAAGPGPGGASPRGSAPGGGQPDVELVRQRWPDILDVVRGERRVAWILLRAATVASLDGGLLTIAFPREGEAKGFATSGCDQVLIAALSSMLGLNVRVRAIVGGEPGTAGPPSGGDPGHPGGGYGGPAGPGQGGYSGSGGSGLEAGPAAGRTGGPARAGTSGHAEASGYTGVSGSGGSPDHGGSSEPGASREASGYFGYSAGQEAGGRTRTADAGDHSRAGGHQAGGTGAGPGHSAGSGRSGSAAGVDPGWAGPGEPAGPPASPVAAAAGAQAGAPPAQAGNSGAQAAKAAAQAARRSATGGQAANGGSGGAATATRRESAFSDDEWPDDVSEPGSAPAGAGLTGMELIQRQLGGQIIAEIDEA